MQAAPVGPGMPRRRSPGTPPARVHLDEGEQAAARHLVLHGLRHLRASAQALLEEGADKDQLADVRLVITASLAGDAVVMARFGADIKSIEKAAKRIRTAGLQDTALWCTVVHATANRYKPSMSFLGYGGAELRQGCTAWRPSSRVDPTIPVRRRPSPHQLDMWEPDERDPL